MSSLYRDSWGAQGCIAATAHGSTHSQENGMEADLGKAWYFHDTFHGFAAVSELTGVPDPKRRMVWSD